MNKALLSTIVSALVLGTTALSADEATKAPASSRSVAAKAVIDAKKDAGKTKGRVKLVQEAVDAVALTQKAIVALDKQKNDEALKAIEKAVGKLEVVLADPKAPALLPVDARVSASEFLGTPEDVDTAVITSVALLGKHKVQEARMIVQTLKDEIDVITINLPLASYPAALKLAAKYLHEKKPALARHVLSAALGTFVEVDLVTPLGIVKAQELVKAADRIAKKDKKQALAYLEAAKLALKKDEALGYTSRSDTTYKMLNDTIKKVEKEVKGKNEATKLFDELIAKLKEFKEKAVKSVKK